MFYTGKLNCYIKKSGKRRPVGLAQQFGNIFMVSLRAERGNLTK